MGDVECATTVDGSVAALTGGDVQQYRTLTAGVGLTPATVADAEPTLEERRVSDRTMVAADGTLTVMPDGRVSVQQTLTHLFARGQAHESLLTFPARRAWPDASESNQRFEIDGLQITTADGTVLTPTTDTRRYQTDDYDDTLRVSAATPGNREDITVAYDVLGAAWTVDGTSSFAWPYSLVADYTRDATFTWTFPGSVTSADCVDVSYGNDEPCSVQPTVSGREVTAAGEGTYDPFSERELRAELAPGSISAAPLLETNLARAEREHTQWGMGLGGLALLVAGGVVAVLRRLTAPRDRRFIDVAPSPRCAP